ncbi:hypothetical protein MNBD_GAMMA16-1164 [hydrothermal vent metagenome]|uniref:Uncharacterized protein n=1 Tax=hydrothermal vent metagenome TaxID=652676 RepID=A0A3B0ZHS6_9ZZZZ
MNIMKNSPTYQNYALTYLLILISGSSLYNANKEMILLSVFPCLVALMLVSKKRISIVFFFYCLLMLAILLALFFYTQGSLPLPSIIGTMMSLFIAYAILSIVREHFLESFVRVVMVIAVISLIGYSIDSLGFRPVMLSILPGEAWKFIYHFDYHIHLERNNAIFYEPGAYQVYLNAAIFVLAFSNVSIPRKTKLIFFAVLVVTLLTTGSTTGYLMFAFLLLVMLLKSPLLTGKLKVGVLVFGAIMMASSPLLLNEIILKKLESYTSIKDITDSDNRRSLDVLVDIEVFKSYPFGAGYDEYSKNFAQVGQLKEGTGSSNGFTRTFAIYGFPFTLFFFGTLFFFFYKFFHDRVVIFSGFFLLMVFLYSQSNFVFSHIILALIAAIFVYDAPHREKKL